MDHPYLQKKTSILAEQCFSSISTWSVPKTDFIILSCVYCNVTTDLFGGCWKNTLPGETLKIDCPPIISPNPIGFATRLCLANGTWAIADYHCIWQGEKEISQLPVYIFIAGYTLSIVFLTISLAIFFGCRQLQCGRVTIHKNLFLSYIFTGITWICYLVVLRTPVILNNPVWCQCLHVLAQYFIVCNFSWMFCEGLYLHTILLKAFSTGRSLLVVCCFIGWVFPLIPTAIYCIIRYFHGDASQCWYKVSSLQWIMYGPIVFSLVVNLCFLVNIVRLLMTKLRQIPDAPQTKKAARATLVLIPLLGLQYLLVPIKPEKDTPLEEIYLYFTAVAISLQGAFVSIIYCFCNGEVVSIFKRRWNQHLLMRGNHGSRLGGVSMTTYTVTEQCTKDDDHV